MRIFKFSVLFSGFSALQKERDFSKTLVFFLFPRYISCVTAGSRTCCESCRTAIRARAGTWPKCHPPSRDCCNTDKSNPGAHQHSLLLPATPTTAPTSPTSLRTAETLNCPLTQHFSSIYPKCTTPLSQCHPNT